jgi:hypothetical protein
MYYILIKIAPIFLTVRSFSLSSISCNYCPCRHTMLVAKNVQFTNFCFFHKLVILLLPLYVYVCLHAYSNTKLFIRMIMDNSLVSAAKTPFET